MNKKIIFISIAIGAVIVSTMLIAAYFAVGSVQNGTGNLINATYKPDSAWIEPGLDPNVTTFDIVKDGAPATPVADSVIQKHIQDRQTDLMPCYTSGLDQWDDFGGRVDFEFGIAPDGHLAMSRVTASDLEDKQTEDCFVERSKPWKFPPTGRASLTKVNADFTFSYE